MFRLFGNKIPKAVTKRPSRRLELETLEDRVLMASRVLVATAGAMPAARPAVISQLPVNPALLASRSITLPGGSSLTAAIIPTTPTASSALTEALQGLNPNDALLGRLAAGRLPGESLQAVSDQAARPADGQATLLGSALLMGNVQTLRTSASMDATAGDFHAGNAGLYSDGTSSDQEKKKDEKGWFDHVVETVKNFDLIDAVMDTAEEAAGKVSGAAGAVGAVAGAAWDLLNAPRQVEQVTGDPKDLVNGVAANARQGKEGTGNITAAEMLKQVEYQNPNPENDYVMNAQAQAAVAAVLAAANVSARQGLVFSQDLISQPLPGQNSVPRDESVLKTVDRQAMMTGRAGNYINPGTGDDTGGQGGGSGGILPSQGVKDPPKADADDSGGQKGGGTTPVQA